MLPDPADFYRFKDRTQLNRIYHRLSSLVRWGSGKDKVLIVPYTISLGVLLSDTSLSVNYQV